MLVLGARGFAGQHLVPAAREAGFDVVTASRAEGQADVRCELLDPGSVEGALAESAPDAVVNVAGAASVAWSWSDPAGALSVNGIGTLNLLEGVARHAPEAHVTCVSSAEVYGAVSEDDLPVTEDAPVRPLNPYGTTKASMELICGQYARGGLGVAVMRAFNHLGPGQSDAFAASNFARQIAEAEATGAGELELNTGDLSPVRDFTDVRDVVRAYVLAARSGLAGIFNVCSGKGVGLETVVGLLTDRTAIPVRVEVDESRLRPAEAPHVWGSSERLRDATDWAPEIPLERTLDDLLGWWRGRVGAGRPES
jgi:GDP-4-dehydro-6-deoxy-D-mannose reductase